MREMLTISVFHLFILTSITPTPPSLPPSSPHPSHLTSLTPSLPPSLSPSLPPSNRLEAQLSSHLEEVQSLPKREEVARLEVQFEAAQKETATKQQVYHRQ